MFPAAERYLALAARGRNEWWRYLAGVITVIFFFEFLGYVPYWLAMQYTDFGSREQFIGLNAGMLVGFAVWLYGAPDRAKTLADRWPKLHQGSLNKCQFSWFCENKITNRAKEALERLRNAIGGSSKTE